MLYVVCCVSFFPFPSTGKPARISFRTLSHPSDLSVHTSISTVHCACAMRIACKMQDFETPIILSYYRYVACYAIKTDQVIIIDHHSTKSTIHTPTWIRRVHCCINIRSSLGETKGTFKPLLVLYLSYTLHIGKLREAPFVIDKGTVINCINTTTDN
jgi:hypothetical protein